MKKIICKCCEVVYNDKFNIKIIEEMGVCKKCYDKLRIDKQDKNVGK